MQVDPIKHTLKAPGYERLKPRCDDMLSSFGFKFNLRRYTMVVAGSDTTAVAVAWTVHHLAGAPEWQRRCRDEVLATLGRAVQVDPIKPTLTAPGTKRLKMEFDDLLSSLGFKFNLRRYIWGARTGAARRRHPTSCAARRSCARVSMRPW